MRPIVTPGRRTRLHLCLSRLARPFAKIGNQAFFTKRPSGNTDVAPVQNEPVMRMQFVFRWNHLLELHLDFEGSIAGSQARAVCDAKTVRIDSTRRLAERHI